MEESAPRVVFNVAAAKAEDFSEQDMVFPTVTFQPHQVRLNPRNQIRRESETFRLYKTDEMTQLLYDIVEKVGRRSNFLLSQRNMLRPPKRLHQRILKTILQAG